MALTGPRDPLEGQIEQWRAYLRRRQAVRSVDVEELEDHLRGQIGALVDAGLSSDEAFLVAVKRMGALDAISNEFAREHSERLWKQLVVASENPAAPGGAAFTEGLVVFALAAIAAITVKVPALFGFPMSNDEQVPFFYLRNASLFVLPLLTGYFAWKRGLNLRTWRWLALAFAAAALFANVYPFAAGAVPGDTEALTALHLPIALWLAVGIAYAGGRWGLTAGRMDFIRFSGELFIYYVLIGLGGGVLMVFTMIIFSAIGVNAAPVVFPWLLPCGMAGAVLVGSWLVEAKQSVIENLAPVLTRLFTPLFALALWAFLATMMFTGRGIDMERQVLIVFDVLLLLVLGLTLYSISARDPGAPVGASDLALMVTLTGALTADVVALANIAARISEFGFTPNRIAALGENVVLLVNLGWSAALYLQFLRNAIPFSRIERWQTEYLPVYSAWAAIVVVVFPPLFGYR